MDGGLGWVRGQVTRRMGWGQAGGGVHVSEGGKLAGGMGALEGGAGWRLISSPGLRHTQPLTPVAFLRRPKLGGGDEPSCWWVPGSGRNVGRQRGRSELGWGRGTRPQGLTDPGRRW